VLLQTLPLRTCPWVAILGRLQRPAKSEGIPIDHEDYFLHHWELENGRLKLYEEYPTAIGSPNPAEPTENISVEVDCRNAVGQVHAPQ
jgi:hypothetical protein